MNGEPLPPLPNVGFETSQRNVAYFDQDTWTQQDFELTNFIAKELALVIDRYLAKTSSIPIPFGKKDTKEEEEQEVLTEDKDQTRIDGLLDRLADAGTTYATEAAFLQTVLLPQFFEVYGFTGTLDRLESLNSRDFLDIQREFALEIQGVLRSLSTSDYDKFKAGNKAGFRLLVIRKLHARLRTNARFFAAIANYREGYVEVLKQRRDSYSDGSIEKKLVQKELDKLNKVQNLPTAEIDRKIAQTAQTGDWGERLFTPAEAGKKALVDLRNLSSLTQQDFRFLLSKLGFDSSQGGKLIANLDGLMGRGFSPEQVTGLSPSDLKFILGTDLKSLDTTNRTKFLGLLKEYMYARRGRIEKTYQLHDAGRDGKNAGIIVNADGSSTLTEAGRQEIEKTHQDIDELQQKNINTESYVVALASTKTQTDIYREADLTYAKEIEEIRQKEETERFAAFQQEQNRQRQQFANLTAAEIQKVGQQQGLLAEETLQMELDKEQLLVAVNQALAEQDQLRRSELGKFSYRDAQNNGKMVGPSGDVRYGQGSENEDVSLQSVALQQQAKAQALRVAQQAKKKQETEKTAADELKEAVKDKAIGAALVPILGPFAATKTTRAIGGVGLLSMVGSSIWKFANGGIFTKAFGVIGGIGGGALTGAGSFGLMTIPGAVIGSFGGTNVGYALDNLLGLTNARMSIKSPGILNGNIGKTLFGPSSKVATPVAIEPVSTGVGLGKMGVVGSIGLGTAVVVTTLISGSIGIFLPPSLGTIDQTGQESKYVTLTKVAMEGNQFDNENIPAQITYKIYVEANTDPITKEKYAVEITGFSDDISFRGNTTKRAGKPDPTLRKISEMCPNMTFDSFQKSLSTASVPEGITPLTVANDGVLSPAESKTGGSDGRAYIGECVVPFDSSYTDSSVQNSFVLSFNVTSPSENLTGQTAETAELICFGECPQKQQGGWPTEGRLTMGPFETIGATTTHAKADAIDIALSNKEKLVNPVYSTFSGTAYFLTKPPGEGYGNHVVLVTDQGFALVFGHLQSFAPGFNVGDVKQVQPCTILGMMGATGNVTGKHLHYEYRISTGKSYFSTAAPRRGYLEGFTGGYKGGDYVTPSCGT